MADAKKFLGGAYLKAADLKGRVVVTIEDVTEATMPDKKGGFVLNFTGKEKTLFLNTTNTNTLIDLYGDDTDNWIDQRITLFVAKVDYQGKRVPAIRLAPPPPAPKTQAVRRTVAPPPEPEPDEPEAEGKELTEDDIPF